MNEDSLSFATIRDVCLGGEGHYLGAAQTLKVMKTEFIYPDFSDRTSPDVWSENDQPVLLNQAIAKRDEILKQHFPSHISGAIDAEIRAKFPIFLSREAMAGAD